MPLEIFETEEVVEKTDESEPFESRRANCSDGLRGGKAGDGWAETLRAGKFGCGFGFGGSETFWPVRMILGGGRTSTREEPLGWFPMPLPLDVVCFASMTGGTLEETLL